MYDSPINVIYGELQTKVEKDLENHIFESVQSVGVMVDKDELIKALQYDRQQYEKGLADGKREFAIYMLGRIAAIEMMSGIDLVSLKDACSKVLEETGGTNENID